VGRATTGERVHAAFSANGAFLMGFSPTAEARDTTSLYFGRVAMLHGTFESAEVHAHALPGTVSSFMAQEKVLGTYADRRVDGRLTSGPTTTGFQLTWVPGSATPPSLDQIQGTFTDTLKIFRRSLPSNHVHPTLALRIGPDGELAGAMALPSGAGPIVGRLRPRPDCNAFDVDLKVDEDEELYPLGKDRTYVGLAFYDPATRAFQFAVRSSDGSALGFFAHGPE
jgi:hypothetical protein